MESQILSCAGDAVHPALRKKEGLDMMLQQGVGAGRGVAPPVQSSESSFIRRV